MTAPGGPEAPLVAAGSLVRPYTVTGGRTRPAHALHMVSLVKSTGKTEPTVLKPGHAAVLDLCQGTGVAVAEIAGRLRRPLFAIKILIADLMDEGAVTTRTDTAPDDGPADAVAAPAADRAMLERVLHGLHSL